MSQVGIVILNYNNTKEIIGCIESIITYLPKDKIKCVVVDNGSNDLNREYIHSYLKKNSSYRRLNGGDRCDALEDFSYLCLPKNVGYACGNNAGIDFLNQYESITHIMILNSDIIITEDIVTPLLQQIEQLPNVGALSPLLYTPSGEVDHCCARYNYPIDILKYTFSYLYAKRYNESNKSLKVFLREPTLINKKIVEIELPSGSCMLFRKDTLNEIGGFDPNTFLYYEESIMYKRLKEKGKQNYILPSVSCIHIGGSTTTNQKTAYFLKKCNYESLLYYLETYEKVPFGVKIYIKFTGKMRLARLKLGLIYKKIMRRNKNKV